MEFEAVEKIVAAYSGPTLMAALNYVADMTYCGADAEWHFKAGYDPLRVLDALGDEGPSPRRPPICEDCGKNRSAVPTREHTGQI